MPQLFNRAGMSSTTSGTGTVTLASALGAVAVNSASFQTFSSAGVTDGTVVSYLILDSNGNWEAGTGTYTASGTTLSRTTKFSSNGNAAINLSGTEQVFITALASDGGDVLGGTTNPMRGFDTPVNLSLTASTDGTILTINVVGNNAGNPSPTNPVFIPFRDATAGNGDPVWRAVTAALSINTNSAGASLGSVNNTAFRLWVVAFDDSGTVRLALINCSTATQLFPLTEGQVQSTTNISGAATSAGVFYTPSGINLVARPFRILGYIEYSSTGLATAGTYTRVPDFMQLFGCGIKKPGDLVRWNSGSTNAGAANNTTSYAATNLTASITPTSAANFIHVVVSGSGQQTVTAKRSFTQVRRGGVACPNSPEKTQFNNTGGNIASDINFDFYDAPNSNASQTYTVYNKTDAGGTAIFPDNTATANAQIRIEEIMG